MANQNRSVFISYRRDVGGYFARSLWKNLTDLGIEAFLDFESIGAGNFERVILTQIAARPYTIPVLVPGTLKRCTEPNDLMRREIEEALATDRILVPVHSPEFDFEDIDRYLPVGTPAHRLREFNAYQIPLRDFDEAVDKLVERFLRPTGLDLTEAPADAVASAAGQVSQISKAPEVTAGDLTAEAFFARGFSHHETGDLESAIAGYDEAIRINPGYWVALHNRGTAHLQRGQKSLARRDLKRALDLAEEGQPGQGDLRDLARAFVAAEGEDGSIGVSLLSNAELEDAAALKRRSWKQRRRWWRR